MLRFPYSFGDFKLLDFSKANYRTVLYLSTIISGFSSLVYQVVWQRYLAILVGSEARSLSLIVAIFLFGLASGYYFFGKFTERNWLRQKLLKAYGYVELGIASYAILFPNIFPILKELSFNGPSFFLFDVLITCMAIFLPTFLMGASIPMLTMVVPDVAEEVNHCHAKIYGWNTFGAFVGTLGAGFFLVPNYGLPITIYIAGLLNVCIAFIFILNRLKGAAHKAKEIPIVQTKAPNWFYLLFVLITGAITISLEISLVRVLNLSMGSNVYGFPIILSIFILALASGSLCLKNISSKILASRLLFSTLFLCILSFTAPYWSSWISHIRISLSTLESSYYVFISIIYIFVFLFLFPPIFFLGQLLPLAYGLIQKTKENYGSICGKLYFCNTIGTVLGSIILAYLALYIFSLDEIFKINLILLVLLTLIFSKYEKFLKTAFLSFLFLIFAIFLSWDRGGHYLGYFRLRAPISEVHFKGIFELPFVMKDMKAAYFEDGPNTTVTLLGSKNRLSSEAERLKKIGFPSESYSIVVNGKSDSNIQGDFTTVFLLSILPYLHLSEEKRAHNAAVIGMGTGVSAGILGKLDTVKEVTVLEISSKLLEAVKKIDTLNFNASTNPKIKTIETDAFKYFTRNKRKFDLIVSEPSNPWVVGVENLFTLDFYTLARDSLSSEGILAQWVQLYDIDKKTFQVMLEPVVKVFPYISLYQIGRKDALILASVKPLEREVLEGNLKENLFLKPFLHEMGIRDKKDIDATKIISDNALKLIGKSNLKGLHSLEFPKLSYMAFKDFFLGRQVIPSTVLPGMIQRKFSFDKNIALAFKKYKDMEEKEIKERCSHLMNFLCRKMLIAVKNWKIMEDSKKGISQRIIAYNFLRRNGYIEKNEKFSKEIKAKVLESMKKEKRLEIRAKILSSYIGELVAEGALSKAQKELQEFKQYISATHAEKIKGFIEKGEEVLNTYLKVDKEENYLY